MATITTEIEPEAGVEVEPEFPPHRMTVDRYKRLVDSGVYGPKDPVFLWHGRLVEKMTEGDRHAFSSLSLAEFMRRLVPDGWSVRPDKPIVLADASLPEPDLTIVRGRPRDFVNRTPAAADIALVAEVSDSSLLLDSRPVLRAYAANSIPVYWIVNVPKMRVEVYTDPTGPAENPSYRNRIEYGPDDDIPVVLDGTEVGRIPASEILP